jgi:type I restriction enzyme R subunit
MKEAETRQQLIDKRLLEAGWDVNLPHMVTEELAIAAHTSDRVSRPGVKYKTRLFSDYALLGKDGRPLAIVEAKKTAVDPRAGQEQALNYAEKIRDNNKQPMPFVFYTNGHDIYFWDTERYPPRKIYGFPTRDDMQRMQFLRDKNKPLSHEMIKEEITDRPYQIQAIRSILEGLDRKRRQFLLVMATGTGKTRTCISLIDVLIRAHWLQRALFLVDRLALQRQALDAFEEHLPHAPTWPGKGESEFSTNRRVYVATYPTMLHIIEREPGRLSAHFFDLVVADESHRSIYNVYKSIFDYFDALQLGLTATPKDSIDRNTFQLFDCPDGLPTFAYSFEEAINHAPPYLCDFEVLKIRTRFQAQGINSKTISLAEQERLKAEGIDAETINFDGTELERRVSNKGTNRLIVKTFMEECIKDPNGVLPGKSIIFAISVKHAYRLAEAFDDLYPEYKGRLARVVVSEVEGVHDKGGPLDRFKGQDMPRVAISVDMLDTGIDIREVVNLVFAKPVFTYSKFWQMIGRGTRRLDPGNIKPWCPGKDKFLIMDAWENFEFFQMHPKGREPQTQIPLPVQWFSAKVYKLEAALEMEATVIEEKMKSSIMQDIRALPQGSVIVQEAKALLEEIGEPDFWRHLSKTEIDRLLTQVAPVMRAMSGVDFKAMAFEKDVIDYGTARLLADAEMMDLLSLDIMAQVEDLPRNLNQVAAQRKWIERVLDFTSWKDFSDDDLDEIMARLGPLMKLRRPRSMTQVLLNIQDLLDVKEYIEFGPENERLTVATYRQKVELAIQRLMLSNPVLQKLQKGMALTPAEIRALADLLGRQDPYVTEELLKKAYDNKKATFIQFIKHILGLEKLTTFSEMVTSAFDQFIVQHNDYTRQQIQFLLTLKTFILQNEKVTKKDLVHLPFTRLHPHGIRGVFSAGDIEEILELTHRLTA